MSDPSEHFDANGSPLPASACPRCGHVMDCATPMFGDARPQAGDVTVCIRCAQLCAYEPSMTLRALTDEEFIELPLDMRTQLKRATHAVNNVQNQQKPPP